MAPVLTIITPCLNSAGTLAAALTSVRDANLGDQVEHVVVDGGSTDGTLDILASAEGVRWVSEPDRGLSDAMNKGLRIADGQVIGWLNADDYYLPGALRRVVDTLEDHPDMVWLTAPCVVVDEAGNEIRSLVTRYKRMLLARHSVRALIVQNYIAAPATFFRRDAVLAAGGFDERFRYSMDYDLWLRLARRAHPVILDEPVTAFRMAEGSLSMTGFRDQFAEHETNAREHGAGHRAAVAANAVISRAIVATYWLMRTLRRASKARQ